jgi:ribosomal protein L11 methyltransferase
MAGVEIRSELPLGAIESADAVLLEKGDPRWSIHEDVASRRAWVVGIFDKAAEAHAAWAGVRADLPRAGAAVVRPLADADWRESYKAHFKPWRIGRLHWVPEWERRTYTVPPGHAAVWLDPGMAFGTGNHETTRLCVEQLVAFAKRCTPAERRSARVIDAGCGSGILAISAAKLGFGSVFAFDNDPEAVSIAVENARVNRVASRVRLSVADVAAALARRRADLVLANIQADVLVRHAALLGRAMAPGGWLVLSGILTSELAAVEAAFRDVLPRWRFSRCSMGLWSRLCCRAGGRLFTNVTER